MGMYTELVIGCRIPGTELDAIDVLQDWHRDNADAPSHPLFKTERWGHIGCSGSYYFPVTRGDMRFRSDTISEEWELDIRCSFKNYGNEVALFIDWLKSINAEGKGDRGFAGYHMYEEDDEPTLIYLKGEQ